MNPAKILRRTARNLAISVLPESLSHRMIRDMLRIPPLPSEGFQLKIADSIGELRSAWRLLHDNYVREGYTKPSVKGYRITPYHFLPDTLNVIVKKDADVIATLSIFRASPFCLPLQAQFDLSALLAKTPRAVEISSLAVDPRHRGDHGEILFALMKFCYHCNVDLLDAQLELIGVNPRMVPFYRAILLYERVAGARQPRYEFVNGAPVVPLAFDLTRAMEIYSKVFEGHPPQTNVRDFFLAPPPKSFQLPSRSELAKVLPQARPEQLREMLNLDPEVPVKITPLQWDALETGYRDYPDSLEVIRHARTRFSSSVH